MTIGQPQHESAPPRRGGWRLIRYLSALSFTWIFFSAAPSGLSQSTDTAEYPLKLALLYKFAQFVEWPPDAFPDASAPLVVCVVGEDPFQADLTQELRTRSIGSHRVALTTIKRTADMRACHVVFIAASEKRFAPSIVASARDANALSVGETKGFAQGGGVIAFTIEGNKLNFEINIDAAIQSRLKINSKLLALARVVQNQSPLRPYPSIEELTRPVPQDASDVFDAVARLNLNKQLNRLPSEHFNMLVFALKPPPGLIAPMPATQALRSEQLLEWAETEGGCGLRAIKTLVDKINQDDQ